MTGLTVDSETVASTQRNAVIGYVRSHPWSTSAAALALLLLVPGIFIYVKYYRIVTETLRAGPFSNSSNIYAAPRLLSPGAEITPATIVAGLDRAGYSTSPTNTKGWYRTTANTLEVHPGQTSYFQSHPALIRFTKKGEVGDMVSLTDNTKLESYRLEPELITNLVDGDREKRRLVSYREIPSMLVHAVVSAEDKRFFEHIGFDPFRLVKAAYVDAKTRHKGQGASTITMQLARGLWLDPEKRWRRKFSELMITLVLEQRLSKEEIFQYYANQVYLGRSDSFSIHGFGEAARAYFNKDLSQITLPEAALLAGLIQRPSFINPLRYPQRAKDRRNVVLRLMQENNYITPEQYSRAVKEPVQVNPHVLDAGDAPYFIPLVNDELQARLSENEDAGRLQVYTTLDPDLQRAAVEAVHTVMPKVDALIKAKKIAPDGAIPQVALIAMDPVTGAVKAVVGGRDYSKSQLNHALSLRQPGSVFKPFVYAAALTTAIDGSKSVFTPASTIVDQPASFKGIRGELYQPSNFEKHFYGTVTLRSALSRSLNVATVLLAEKVGYQRIVNLAHRCGLNEQILPTPSVALGSYETTPLEIAGAYTAFANHGEYVKPTFIAKVDANGRTLMEGGADRRQVLDRRVTFVIDDMLQEVLRSGTGAGVRSLGFKDRAAGKTGTSRDGWFAGFTPDLLCVVWIGFDDNRELKLEGAKSALPVWAEFMKRAVKYHPASRKFDRPPRGVIALNVDPVNGLLASPECGPARAEYFIAGSEPRKMCDPSDPTYIVSDEGEVVLTSRDGVADRAMPTASPRADVR